MTSPYNQLLNATRFRQSTVTDRDLVTESESDRGRLLFCAAFRRLQQKAQVFSLEPNAAVRSRLTHSMEVAQIGRYISDLVSAKLKEKNLIDEKMGSAIVNFVETACLMHDIGNPPFGHFGEAAIQNWFDERGMDLIVVAAKCNDLEEDSIKPFLMDFLEFDGNPQGLRIVSRLQWNKDEHGLNLTKTTLATYLKYIRGGDPRIKITSGRHVKKCGYFSSEEMIVRKVWNQFNYGDMPRRFPLAYIMEAADDIAYCISDLEDSSEKGLVKLKDALGCLLSNWRYDGAEDGIVQDIKSVLKKGADGVDGKGECFTYIDFRTELTRLLVRFAANQYIDQHDMIMKGELDTLIPEESAAGYMLESLKNYCRENVYRHESVQRIELAGYAAISGLLGHFECLLACSKERFQHALNFSSKDEENKPIVIEKKLLALFPRKYKMVYQYHIDQLKEGDPELRLKEWSFRAHLITDFISGMTDDFAMTTFRELSGMQL